MSVRMLQGRKNRALALTIAILALLLIIVPNFLGVALVSLLTKVLIFALLAMSLDLLYGFSGLWSFCQAALFGVGAYTTGILIKHFGITSFWLSAPAGVLLTAVVAALFGLIALRVSAIYLLLMTFALGQLVYSVVFQWKDMTGGANGLSGIPFPDMGFVNFTPMSYYYFTLVITAICVFVLYLIVRSPFGYSLRGIRENDLRMRSLGYNIWLHKYLAFVISGVFAGIAGVLYIHYNGFVGPTDVGFVNSGSIILMILVGGVGTLWGGAIGSVVFISLSYFVSIVTPERWPLIMGFAFVAVVMFLRGGVWTQLSRLWTKGKPETQRAKLWSRGKL